MQSSRPAKAVSVATENFFGVLVSLPQTEHFGGEPGSTPGTVILLFGAHWGMGALRILLLCVWDNPSGENNDVSIQKMISCAIAGRNCTTPLHTALWW